MPILKSGLDTAGEKAKTLEVVLDPEKADRGSCPCYSNVMRIPGALLLGEEMHFSSQYWTRCSWWCQHTFGRQKQCKLWVQVSLDCIARPGSTWAARNMGYLTQNGICYVNICLYICNQIICFDNLFYFETGSRCLTQINFLSSKFWDYNYGTLTDIKDHMYMITFHDPTPTQGSYSLCFFASEP